MAFFRFSLLVCVCLWINCDVVWMTGTAEPELCWTWLQWTQWTGIELMSVTTVFCVTTVCDICNFSSFFTSVHVLTYCALFNELQQLSLITCVWLQKRQQWIDKIDKMDDKQKLKHWSRIFDCNEFNVEETRRIQVTFFYPCSLNNSPSPSIHYLIFLIL